MKIIRNHVIITLTLIIFLSLAATFVTVLLELERYVTLLFLAFSAVLSLGVMWLQRHHGSARERIRNTSELARTIEAHINDKFETIHMDESTPEEIVPLVNSINDLLRYFEDRYIQERDFTANASHELRTPLAGIRLQTEIAMKAQTAEQREKAHKNIIKAADRGTRLVEQLLTLSRLTADKVELAMEAVSLGEIAAITVAELTDHAENNKISLRIDHRDEGYVEASEDSISILMHNLVRNAIAYCPCGSTVSLSVKRRAGKIFFGAVLD